MISDTIRSMRQRAHDARRQHFRELAAIDTLTGNTPSPLEGLG